ncbi:MAG TPA: hypothetical protein PLK55_01240 [archaeon]|jgi:hypothetical protein|nr:hypothetical protein [archaeon]
MSSKLFKNPILEKIISGIGIIVIGYVLLILTFLLAAVFQGLLSRLFGLFIQFNEHSPYIIIPGIMRILFLIFIFLISWLILHKSKLPDFWKATFMVVPLATALVTIGIFFYQTPAIVYLLGLIFGIAIFYYLYKTKKSWLYYFSLFFISILMLLVQFLKIEI